jgi:hypothetical protein
VYRTELDGGPDANKTISRSAAKLIRRSLQRRADREEMDSYRELLKLDDFNEPEGQ